MGLVNGAVAKVKVGENTLGYISGVDLELSTDVDDIKVLGSEWTETNPNFKAWKADADGYLDAGDAGQQALQQAFLNGTDVEMEIYEDETNYWSGKAHIENLKISIKDSTTEISTSFKGNGELKAPGTQG